MKQKLLCFLLCLFSVTVSLANVSEGSSIPSFSLPKLNGGGNVSSSSLRGKSTLVDFWASWCIPCRSAFRAYEKMHQQGIHVIAINIDKDKNLALDFLKKNPVSFTVLFDQGGAIASQFGLPTMPTTYLVDKSGKVVKVYPGFKQGDETEILNDIKGAG